MSSHLPAEHEEPQEFASFGEDDVEDDDDLDGADGDGHVGGAAALYSCVWLRIVGVSSSPSSLPPCPNMPFNLFMKLNLPFFLRISTLSSISFFY